MNGILQSLLTKRYGPPNVVSSGPLVEHRWSTQNESLYSVLYQKMHWDNPSQTKYGAYRDLYGSALGGFLIGNSLKIAMLAGQRVFGLYLIEELQDQPEVRAALRLDPSIHFFLDAANVWFYGLKSGDLYVYDAETMELDCLGSLEIELERLLLEWEHAHSQK